MTTHRAAALSVLLLLAALSGGCGLIGGIFKAGMATGIVIVVLILVALVVIMTKVRR